MKFIESWSGLSRMIILITFCTVVLFSSLLLFQKYRIVNSINIKGDGVTIGITPWNEVSILSTLVSSTQIINSTNITIENNKYIKIQSHGSVYTGSGTDLFGIKDLAVDINSIIQDLVPPPVFSKIDIQSNKELWYLFLLNKRNQELTIGYRNANGEPLQSSISGYLTNSDQEFQNHCNSLKILPDREYGMILGVFANDENEVKRLLIQEAVERQKVFFPVGKKTEIYTKLDGKARIENSFISEYRSYKDRKFLFLLVNDCILNSEKSFYNGKNKLLVASHEIEKKIHNNFETIDLWFMDNQGYFLTTFAIGNNDN